MSNIDFENGLLVGLAIAYKKAAAAAALEGLLWITVADGVLQSMYDIMAYDALSVLQPEDMRPPAADNTTLPIISVTDTVSVTLT